MYVRPSRQQIAKVSYQSCLPSLCQPWPFVSAASGASGKAQSIDGTGASIDAPATPSSASSHSSGSPDFGFTVSRTSRTVWSYTSSTSSSSRCCATPT